MRWVSRRINVRGFAAFYERFCDSVVGLVMCATEGDLDLAEGQNGKRSAPARPKLRLSSLRPVCPTGFYRTTIKESCSRVCLFWPALVTSVSTRGESLVIPAPLDNFPGHCQVEGRQSH